MRIYKMTATFGKLENQTLTLEPGLNIITAPNEWGKSTWCAFLIAMLYGLDTQAKSRKGSLADKERYAPWSGVPMEGRMDLNWQGRDITIQRRTKGRIPLGEFQAYETDSGLPVKELTAANCGQMLLEVERSVFSRAGFIRHADLPVTEDAALRRRLNALVTTGDENSAGDRLASSLKDLKNRCRYNKTGLLPQAEKIRENLAAKLEELNDLETQSEKLSQRLEEVDAWISQLENHRQTMEYAAAQANAGRLDQARNALTQAEEAFRAQEAVCEKLPPREEAEHKIQQLRDYREQLKSLQMEQQMLPQEPEEPVLPRPFTGLSLKQAWAMVRDDEAFYRSAEGAKAPLILMILGLLGILGVALLLYLRVYIPAAIATGAVLLALLWSLREQSLLKKQTEGLLRKYGTRDCQRWSGPLSEYEEQFAQYQQDWQEYRDASGNIDIRSRKLQKQGEALCGSQEPEAVLEFWQQVRQSWEDYHTARREALRAGSHFDTLSGVIKPVEPPAWQDTLSYSEAETARLLSDGKAEQQRLMNRLGQYQGRIEALGRRETLEDQLQAQDSRIAQLTDTYWALSIAMETLADARAELQRRFAPRISKRAQQLLAAMTQGRYHSLTMGEDFSLQASAEEEGTLREVLWRSDGTLDQLYLSLRLAVAEELTPQAPLILDDALVRFDDGRMGAALEILRDMSREKQVILFTCQGREATVS